MIVVGPETPEIRRLGEAVASDDELIAISAPTDGDDALEPGRVRILRASTGARGTLELHLEAELQTSASVPGDHFGASLAVKHRCAEAEGRDLVAIGADRADAGTGERGAMAGAVELYERTVGRDTPWRLAARLVAREHEPGASFGAAIAFDRADSTRLAIGAPRHDAVGAFDAGRVHVFRRIVTNGGPAGDPRWEEVASITPPTPRLSMWFGAAVAIEGDLLAIASPGDDVAADGGSQPIHAAGAVYLYRRVTVSAAGSERYRLERVLTSPTPESAAWFGLTIALDDGVLAVGAPRARDLATGTLPTGCVYLFDLTHADTAPKRVDPPAGAVTYGFGQALALRSRNLVIGAPSTDRDERALLGKPIEDAGAAWIYALSDARYLAELNPPKPLQSGLFGASCAIGSVDRPMATDPDGTTHPLNFAVIGHRYAEEESIAPSRGAAWFVVPRTTLRVTAAPVAVTSRAPAAPP